MQFFWGAIAVSWGGSGLWEYVQGSVGGWQVEELDLRGKMKGAGKKVAQRRQSDDQKCSVGFEK